MSVSDADDHGTASLAGRSVFLGCINYAPEHAGIGPYATQIAEHLARSGAQVEVVTGVPHYPSWTVAPEYRRMLRSTRVDNDVLVRRLRHYVPRHQSGVRRALYETTFLAQALTLRPTRRPDVVIDISPSLAASVAGQRLAHRLGVPNVLMIQDFMGAAAAQSGISGGDRLASLVDGIERRLVRGATRVAVIHDSFRPRALAMGADPARLDVVRNWTHIARPTRPREEVRARLGWTPDRFVVLHAGNMGLKQGLDVVIEAARRARAAAPSLLFELLGDGNQRATLEQAAQGLPNVHFRDPVEDDLFSDVLGAADLLLVTQRASVLDMSLPSKLTSYFAAGRPVLASVAGGGTQHEVDSSGGGRVVAPEDPDALWHEALAFAADPDAATAIGATGQRYALDNLSAEAGLARVSAILGRALSDGAAGGRGTA